MAAPASGSEARHVVLRFYHTAEWLVAAVVVAAALALQAELRDNLNLYIAVLAWVIGMIVLARLRWPIKSEATRLLFGITLSQCGIAAMLWYTAPVLNGLLVVYFLSTTTAWLLLRRARSIRIMLLACVVTLGVIAGGDPAALEWLYAGALCGSYFLTARVAGISMRAAVRAQARAVAQTGRDELTQLPGRHAFLRHAEVVHAKALESRVPYAIELVDIDNLRSINDTYGYSAGDRAIVLVAEALQRLRAPEEFLARFDGDKFVLLVPQLEGDRAEDLARRIRSVVFSTTFDADMDVVRTKANVGVARYPLAGVTLNALISAAERDMKLDQRGREPPGNKPVFRRRSGKLSA